MPAYFPEGLAVITFDPAAFRAMFPQFSDPTAFPDAKLQAHFDAATGYVSADTYGDMKPTSRAYALDLMTAHLLTLGVMAAQGTQPGVTIMSRVGDVQVQLQPPPVKSEWSYWLNTTPHGAQLVALLQAQAVGGFFVGGLPERAAFRKVAGVF